MAADEERVFTAIGGLQKQVTGLSDRFDRLITETMAEHRKVHDIVVATSESIRILTRDVAEMKPLTDDYRLKAAAIEKAVELTDNYKEEQAEKRGAEKFKNWIYGIVASVGGLIAIGVSKVIDRLLAPPHLPVVVAIALVITLVATAAAFSQEHHERHHAYYQNWVNKADRGCCNNQDCGELSEQNERATPAGTIEVKIEGEWCPVLPQHYLKRGNAPDWSTSHVCVAKSYETIKPSVCARLLCYQPRPGT